MGLKAGLNSIYEQGVYVNDSLNALLEYKIFHTDINERDHIIITNLRNGKTWGPIILGKQLGILEEAKITLENFAKNIYPDK
ncbi:MULTISPECIES: hypothetical protein [unclassified Mesobacillus]|uniref:hypothetical protein n=1 Tax=unclassified Mesobacillus TaxID=2675270 RepID=UPI002040526E|nr:MULTISPECIES: hypothetical protein [unclassified Mesobacillus]MCM3122748.1 hypothetical protein [Mesobacillus sp. MER 33]MCM3232712.1 hypothetical protein [Mesobacillus sp. MER 48]